MIIGNTKISIHSRKKQWWRYILPKRLTLKQNPSIYRWTFFVWGKINYEKFRQI